jgi:hypothetical protein
MKTPWVMWIVTVDSVSEFVDSMSGFHLKLDILYNLLRDNYAAYGEATIRISNDSSQSSVLKN